MKLFQDKGVFSLKKYTNFIDVHKISQSSLYKQVEIKLLSDLMDKVIKKKFPKSSINKIPKKIDVDFIYLKSTPDVVSDMSLSDFIDKQLNIKSCLVTEGERRSGYVLELYVDEHKVEELNKSTCDLSSRSRLEYLKQSNIEYSEIKLDDVFIDKDIESQMLFIATKSIIYHKGIAYTACVTDIKSQHVKDVISPEDLDLLKKRNNLYSGSIKEMYKLSEILSNNDSESIRFDPNIYIYSASYSINDKTFSNMIMKPFLTVPEGSMILIKDPDSKKVCIAHVKNIEYYESDSSYNSLFNVFNDVDMNNLLILKMCERFANSQKLS